MLVSRRQCHRQGRLAGGNASRQDERDRGSERQRLSRCRSSAKAETDGSGSIARGRDGRGTDARCGVDAAHGQEGVGVVGRALQGRDEAMQDRGVVQLQAEGTAASFKVDVGIDGAISAQVEHGGSQREGHAFLDHERLVSEWEGMCRATWHGNARSVIGLRHGAPDVWFLNQLLPPRPASRRAWPAMVPIRRMRPRDWACRMSSAASVNTVRSHPAAKRA